MKKISRYEIRRLINEAILNEDSEATLLDKAKYTVRGAIDKVRDKFNPTEEETEETETFTREDYVYNNFLTMYDYKLGTEGKLIATPNPNSNPAAKNMPKLTYRVVRDNNELYVRQPGAQFASLKQALKPNVNSTTQNFPRDIGVDSEDHDIIKDFILNKFKSMGGQPSQTVLQTSGQDGALNESLSRGNLYRRRYHGRY